MTNQIISNERSRLRFLNLGTSGRSCPFESIGGLKNCQIYFRPFFVVEDRAVSVTVRQLSDTNVPPENRAKNMVYKE